MTTALVLGATGFIGGHIARAAVERGWQVRGLRRRPGATGDLDDLPVEWFDGDLDRPDVLAPAFDGAEIVFHAAAYYPRSGRDVPAQVAHAVRQIRTVLDHARRGGAHRLIYTSTLTTIGPPPAGSGRLADERDLYTPGTLPRSAYYECKYAMESEVLRTRDPDSVVLNPTAVLGPGDVHRTVGRVLLAIARGLGVAWIPADTNVVDVREVAQAHLRAVEVGRVGERYLIGGHNLSVRALLTAAAMAAGVAPPRFEISLGWIDAAVWLADRLPGASLFGNHLRAVRFWQPYNCDKALRAFGLAPRPLAETLQDALAWFAAHPARNAE